LLDFLIYTKAEVVFGFCEQGEKVGTKPTPGLIAIRRIHYFFNLIFVFKTLVAAAHHETQPYDLIVHEIRK